MNKLFAKRLNLLLVLVVLVLWTSDILASGIGFQAFLSDPPRVVSAYDDRPNRLSVALYPLSHFVFSDELLFNPTFQYARHEEHAITFGTKYYRTQELIPVSVDADKFLVYRVARGERERRETLMENSLIEAKRGKKRHGLSIGVALPKRFDQMFGEGGANLRVSGYRRITFSGRSQWTDAANSGVARQSKFPSLNMEQISRFDINGTIGSKISVKVSQDNQTDIPLANRLILRYKGTDDDIIKTIEAGNTTLSIPNTRFVGYSSRIQGLFGIKTEVQLGNLRLTAIASQEKGSSETSSITAGGEENAQYIRDYAYAEGRIYDLGYGPNELYSGSPAEIGPNDSIVSIYVYQKEDRQDELTGVRDAWLIINPNEPDIVDTKPDSMRVRQVDPDSYELLYGQDPNRCPIALVFYTQQRKALGVYMQIDRKDAAGNVLSQDTIGVLGSGNVDTLKYLRAVREFNTPSHPTWELMWRNCYRISKNVAIEDVGLKVFKGLPDREGTSSCIDYQVSGGQSQDNYLRILGLDQYNNSKPEQKTPDDILDDRPDVFRPEWGLVIFPSREPFASDTMFVDQSNRRTSRLADTISSFYNYRSSTEKVQNSKYYLQITQLARSSVIPLGRANIIEGSERVTLNGRTLSKGTDYNINYDFGQITLLSDEAIDPNADLNIDFEYAPFLALQKKTLLGMRAEYEWSDNLRFGSTILYKSDKAQERKPRVGQETAKAMIMDFDFDYRMQPMFLTKAVDALPLISTQSQSNLKLSGEIAQSRPNPNVEGVAYVDDFESAVEMLSLGIVRTGWSPASAPVQVLNEVGEPLPEYQRGTVRWHNPPPVLREDVYDADVVAGEGSLQPLRLIFRPKGFQNEIIVDDSGNATCTGELDTTLTTKSWGGITRYFGNRVDATRIQLFELRAKGGRGVLHFDFGQICEDINGDGNANTEDQDRNFALSDNEDTGLDNITDPAEVDECSRPYDPITNPDPAGDNWWYENNGKGYPGNNNRPPVPDSIWNSSQVMPNGQVFWQNVNDVYHYLHYEWQNGMEGNIRDFAVQGLPDEENLAGTFIDIDRSSYFSFKLPLDTLDNMRYVAGSCNDAGWCTYRILVRDPADSEIVVFPGNDDPVWASVTHVRVWFEAEEVGRDSLDIDSVWIADWGFVQSNWQDTLVNVDTTAGDTEGEFYVASVSTEDGTFIPPPDVEAYYDKVQHVEESQRGLALVFSGLEPGYEALATKELVATESYSGYRRLEMYVHGPSDMGADSIMFFLRLGRDSSNFYEYRSYLHSGWDERNYINIDFNMITALKDAADRARENRADPIDTIDFPYRVKGLPNINEVRFIATGLRNESAAPVSGDVWLDELRVTDVRKDVGMAGRVEVSGSMADLISYNVSYQHKDPYFRGLSEATRGGSRNNLGSGKESTNLSYSGRLSVDKLLPRSWGASLPVSYSYFKSEEVPLLRSNSDVVLTEEVRQQEKSQSESQKVSVSESFNKKGGNILFSAFLNRQKMSFSYNRSNRKTVNNPMVFAENYNVRADYDMGIKQDLSVPIFFWTKSIPILKKASESRLSLYPNQWKWSGTYNRSLSVKDDMDYKRTSSFSRTMNGQMNLSYKMFNNLSASYNYSTKRDLSDPDKINFSFNNFRLGQENSYSQSLQTSYDPNLVSFMTSKFSASAKYGDRYDAGSKTLSTDMSRSWSVTGDFRHITLFGGKRSSSRGAQRDKKAGSRTEVRGGTGGAVEDKGKPFYEPVLVGLRFLTGWLDPMTYKYSESFKQSVPGAVIRPDWKYRFGIKTDADVPLGDTRRNPSASESVSYDFGSGFKLLGGGFSTSIAYRRKIDRDLIKAGRDKTEKNSTSWPDLSIRISQFKGIPLIQNQLNWFIKVFSPRTSYSRQIREDFNLDRNFATSRSETISRSPLISLNFKMFRSLSFSGSYTITHSHDEQFNRTTGDPQSETKSTRKSVGASASYKFSSPSGIAIPLFGRLKFKSTVTIDINIKQNSSLSETSNGGGPFVVGTDKSDFSVTPVLSYSFSQQIRGGLTARWQDNNDTKFNRKSHVRSIEIWTEIRF